MNIEKFYCTSCAEATLYNSIKPRFCAFCGQSFAVFSSATIKPKTVNQEINSPEIYNNTFFEPKPTIRPASYYRNKAKTKLEGEEDDLDNEIEDNDLGEFGSDTGENLQTLFGQGLMKRNKGVKFGDIIKKEVTANEQPKQPKVAADRPKPKKPGRPSKKG